MSNRSQSDLQEFCPCMALLSTNPPPSVPCDMDAIVALPQLRRITSKISVETGRYDARVHIVQSKGLHYADNEMHVSLS